MTKTLFRQSFLFDSLDLQQVVPTGQTVVAGGSLATYLCLRRLRLHSLLT